VEEEAYGLAMPSGGGLPKCGVVQVEAELVAVVAEAEAVAVNRADRGKRKMARRTPEQRAMVSSSVGGGGSSVVEDLRPAGRDLYRARACQSAGSWCVCGRVQ